MEKLQPLMTGAELRFLLERGIKNGWWTIDDLDRPSPGWAETNRINDRPECKHMRLPPRQWTNPLRAQTEDDSGPEF